MFVRKSTVKQGKNSYTYLQLVHNHRDKRTGKVKTEIICKLGREDNISKSFITDIISALSPYVEGEYSPAPPNSLVFHTSREFEDLGLRCSVEASGDGKSDQTDHGW